MGSGIVSASIQNKPLLHDTFGLTGTYDIQIDSGKDSKTDRKKLLNENI